MTRGYDYGLTPWGRWFAEALDGFDENGRLSRGKSYADTGKVLELAVESKLVVAQVKGRSNPLYDVTIAFPPLKERELSMLDEIIEADPLLLARIEAGESPPELIERLKARNVSLIPRLWTSMKRSCSCPDRGDPCRHTAAVHYVLAREIDRDPRVLFRLRGIDLAEKYGMVPERDILPPFAVEPRNAPAGFVKVGRMTAAKADAMAAIFRASAAGEPSPEPPCFESYVNLIVSLLPPAPAFAPGDFSLALAEFYHRAEREDAGEVRADETSDSSSESEGVTSELRFSSARYEVVIGGAVREGADSAFPLAAGRRPHLTVRFPDGNVRKMELLAASRLFLGFSSESGDPGYRFLFHFFRHMRAVRRAGAYAPAAYPDGKVLRTLWRPLPLAADVDRALDDLARIEPGLYRPEAPSGRVGRAGLPADGRATVNLLAAALLDEWVRSLEFRPTGESAARRDMIELFFGGGAVRIDRPGERGLAAAVDSWLAVLSLDFGAYRYRFTIEEKRGSEEPAFAMKLDVMLVSAPEDHAVAVPLRTAAKKRGDREVLRVPAALSAYLPEIRSLTVLGSILLEEKRLAAFLSEAASLLSRLGAEVVLPKGLRRALSPRLVLRVTTRGGGSLRSYLDLESMLDYDWRIAIGDEVIDVERFERLVKSGKSLVRFRDGFVAIDPEEAARIFEAARSKKTVGALEILSARLSGDATFSSDAEEIVASLFRERETPLPRGLAAVLRPYQERGYRWVCSNFYNGFGCVLADDMGLGKTVQAIAVILRLMEESLAGDGVLVVAPAALLTNWERELARFAPGISVSRYHGRGRTLFRAARVFLTTYQTAVRDAKKLGEQPFSLLIVDEAHLLKNAQARQSRAVKSLTANYKLALSGTPVENRLEDLRSLFDFSLPGYLGGSEEFKRTWRVPIEVDRDRAKAELLRKITAPFLMRRLKTDSSIIDDLPAKVSIDEYAKLTTEQAALYESIVRKNLEEVYRLEPGLDRSALVLRLITSLKQVCDHPRVYDKESPPEAALSGKCALLLSILEEVLAGQEKVIVFSQYVETLNLLRSVLMAELGVDALIYHGGLGKAARDTAVDRFQNDPARRVFLVSLRAGGLGLNLTAASRVIHYDLWFNPAVENQATDRAFRIGQTRKVFVHRFITTGTFEEKIDAMLRSKRELAEMSVSTGESWLARMGDEELRSVFLC